MIIFIQLLKYFPFSLALIIKRKIPVYFLFDEYFKRFFDILKQLNF